MSKTRMGKRVASLLLSLVMMFSLLPTTVYAEGADTGANYDAVQQTEPVDTVDLREASVIEAVEPAGGVPEGYTLWTPSESDYVIDEESNQFIVSSYKKNIAKAYIYFTAKVTVDGVEYQTVLDSGDKNDFHGNGNAPCFYYLEDGVIVRNLKDRTTEPSQAWVSVSAAYAGSVDLNNNDAAYFVEDVGFVTSLNDVTADRVIVYECNTRPQSLTLCGLTYGIGGWCDVVIDPDGGSFAGHTEAYTAVSGMSGRQTVSGEPVREGYGFAGWAISFTPVENVVTFTAQWADAGSGVNVTEPVDEEGTIKVSVTGVPYDGDTEIRIDARADGSSTPKTVVDVDRQTLLAENCDVTIKTNVGTLVIDAAAWASMAAKAEDGSHADLSIERSDDGKKYIITAMDGSNNIYPAGSNGSVKISVPYEGINPVVYYVDGTTKTDMKATYENGVLTWVTNHFSEFVIEEASTAYVTVNGVNFATLKEAIRAANAGDTVTLLADVNLDSAQTISKQLTLDLNGKTISSTAYRTIQLNAGADLTVKDSASGGKITNTYTGKAYPATIYLNAAGTKFTLEGGTIESDPNVTSLQSVAINSEKSKACEVNIKGGSVIVPEAATEGRGIVASTNSMTLKISGGTITGGLHGVDAYSGSTVNITGGEITAHYVDTGVIKEAYGMRLTGTANVTVAGGTITGVKMNDNGNDLPKVTLASGRVNGSFYSIVTSYKPQPEFTVAENATIVLGNDSAAKFLPDTVKLVQNSDGTYGVKAGAYVAQIGETTYETLEAAFAHAKDGDTITLLTDCSGNGIVVEKEKFTDKGLIVDFNNHTYTVGGVLVGSSGTKSNGFQLNKDNKITFRNGAIYGDASVAGDDTTNWTGAPAILIQNYCDLTLSGMKVSGGSNTVYTMSNNCGNVVIENTTINAGGGGSGRAPFALDACGYGSYTGVSVTVKGTSAINGDIEVSRSASNENAVKLALEGGTVTGELKIDSSIKSGDATTVTKGADVTLDAPTGYMWNDANTLVKAVAEGNGTQYETLQAAIDKAGRNATVKLLADTRENVTIDKAMTLDLNGHTLNGGTEKGKPALTITARTVTIKDSSEAQTGTIMREDTAENSGVSSHYVIDIQGNAWVMFESGTVKNDSGAGGTKGASLVRVGDDSVAKYPGLNIKGGTFTQDNFIVIKVDRGDLFLNGGTLNSAHSYAIEDWHRATIKGGTVNGTVAAWTYSGGLNSDLTISGGTINGDVTSVNYGNAEDKVAKVSITGGTITGELDTRSYDPKTGELTSIDDAAKATIKVTGGTFDKDPTKYVVEDSAVNQNADGTFGVAKAYLAKVGKTSYYTMDEARKAQSTSGEDIVLLRDYTTGSPFRSGISARVVDLNGYTWTCTGKDANSAAFEISNHDAMLTVKNGKVVSSQLVGLIPSAMGGTITYDNSSLVFDGVEMSTTAHSGIETNGNNTNDTVTLKNSTLNVPNGFGIYFPSSGTLTIDKSTINAKTMGVQVCAGSLNINAGSGITVTGDAVPKTGNDGAIEDGAAISIVNRTGYKGLGKIEVTGGTFTAKTGNAAIKAYKWDNTNRTEDEWAEAGTYIAVSGGTFSSAVKEEYCADGYIPTANGDGSYTVVKGTYVAEYNGTKYTSLQEAINAASQKNGGQAVVTLLGDLTITETVNFAKQYGGSVLLNLGGYTLTGEGCRALQINKGNLYLENGTVTSTGIINSSSVIRIGSNEDAYSGVQPQLYMRNGAKVLAPVSYGVTIFGSKTVSEQLTVAGNASIEATGPSPAISGQGGQAYHVDGKGTKVIITGNAVVSATNNYAIYHPDNGTLTVQGNASVSGKGGIQMCSGTLDISYGSPKIEALGKADHETGAAGPIYDVAAISVVNRSYPGGAPVVTIKGTPTITAVDGEVIHAYTWSSGAESEWAEAGDNINVSGGTYSKDFKEAYLAADCTLVPNGDTTYTVKQEPVAEYNGTQYTSLAQALQDARNAGGGEVKLLKDVTQTTSSLDIGKVTLDLNTKTLTLDGGAQLYTSNAATIKNGTIKRTDEPTSGNANDFAIQVMSGSSLTLGTTSADTVTIECTYGVYNVGGTLTVGHANITTDGWSVAVDDSASKTGVVTIGEGAVITSKTGNCISTRVGSKPNVTITGGQLTSNGTNWDAGVIYWASEGTLTITGGTFTASSAEGSEAAAVYQKNGTVKISGSATNLLGNKALVVQTGDGSTGTMVTELSGGTYSTKPEEAWVVNGYRAIENTDGSFTVVEGKFTVQVTSRTVSSDTPVANVSGGGETTYEVGTTVTAASLSGYTFKGWYLEKYTDDNSTLVKTDLSFTYHPTADCTLIAVYEPISGAKFYLTVNASEFMVGESAVYDSYMHDQVAAGESVTVRFEGKENFLYWVNASRKVVSISKEYTFIMGSETTLTAVYGKTREAQATVVFMSDSDQIITSKAYKSGTAIQFPTPPIKMGCTFTRWSMTEQEIQAAIAASNNGVIVVKACYTDPSTPYTVTVRYPDDTKEEYSGMVGKTVTLTAKEISGKIFSYWTDSENNVLGYAKTLMLAPSGSITVKAVYSDTAVEAKPVITMTAVEAGEVGTGYYVISFTATRAVPEGYTVVKQGILYSVDSQCSGEGAKDYMKLTDEGSVPAGIYEYEGNNTALSGVTRFNAKTGAVDRTIYGRGYMVLKNSSGTIEYVYSDNILSGNYSNLANIGG